MYKLDKIFNCDLDTQSVAFVFLLFVLRHPLTSHRPAEFHSARVIQVVDLHQKSVSLGVVFTFVHPQRRVGCHRCKVVNCICEEFLKFAGAVRKNVVPGCEIIICFLMNLVIGAIQNKSLFTNINSVKGICFVVKICQFPVAGPIPNESAVRQLQTVCATNQN
jgi:hypothetical protein